jgi:hypothetical protein
MQFCTTESEITVVFVTFRQRFGNLLSLLGKVAWKKAVTKFSQSVTESGKNPSYFTFR